MLLVLPSESLETICMNIGDSIVGTRNFVVGNTILRKVAGTILQNG